MDVRGLRDDERLDGRHAAAGRRRCRGRGTAARGRRRRLLQDEPARVRSREREPRLRHDVQPAGSRPHVGRVEQRLGGARGGRCMRLRARQRHRRLDPDPGRLLRARRASSRRSGWSRSDGVFPLSPTLDHVGPITRTVERAAPAARGDRGPSLRARSRSSGVRVGVLRRQLDDPDLRPLVRDRVSDAAETSPRLGLDVRRRRRPRARPRRRGARPDHPQGGVRDPPPLARDARRTATVRGRGRCSSSARAITDEQYRQGLADKERVAAGFARVLAAGRRSARARPSPTSRRRRIRRSARPTGDVEARFSGPYNLAGIPAVSRPVRARRGRPARPAFSLPPGCIARRSCSRSPRAYEEVSP